MGNIVEPTQAYLNSLVAPYLKAQPSGLGFAIGYASPSFQGVYTSPNPVHNQFGAPLTLSATTPFEIASISKTFTATLYALLIRASDPTRTIGDYIAPNGPLRISASLGDITLDQLMNYTSGLPADNVDGSVDSPPYWPQPYSMPAMLSFLGAAPPTLSPPGQQYQYSNLGFALMSAIIACAGTNANPRIGGFETLMAHNIFGPLGLSASFFDEASLAGLPLGFNYNTTLSPTYQAVAPGWPFFPAYFGAGGIVATPNDMLTWLLFNMGVLQNDILTPLLPVLQKPLPGVTWEGNRLGLGWFISPQQVWKDGDLDGFSSYIAFVPSADPGAVASQAGAFVLVNGDGVTDSQGLDVAASLTNSLLNFMVPAERDQSAYPSSIVNRSRRRARP
ncbi:serine hydrolase domain-containing protein [Methylocapsa palsarum]|uniref:CubicO group peptidase, beta-lactamase class C family n=1 Tax=Methylocapsa palsarum TaxID=1612308 RepID=A0A1I4C1Q3_9HYPH|nr:serine hydrolase domain-containing protein [Methylocapsa palsarum]SFK74081.1 CubicO group peptidase, beta-lactamase class C family [Methylocapsa palsarum]